MWCRELALWTDAAEDEARQGKCRLQCCIASSHLAQHPLKQLSLLCCSCQQVHVQRLSKQC